MKCRQQYRDNIKDGKTNTRNSQEGLLCELELDKRVDGKFNSIINMKYTQYWRKLKRK